VPPFTGLAVKTAGAPEHNVDEFVAMLTDGITELPTTIYPDFTSESVPNELVETNATWYVPACEKLTCGF
jgi:hypothetical protein